MGSNIYRSRKDVRLSGADNPTIATVAEVKDTYRNTTTYELFTCVEKGVVELPTTGLTALYTMDTVSGSSLTDTSGNGNNATLLGTVTSSEGVDGSALFITRGQGLTHGLRLPKPFITGTEFSFSFWIKKTVIVGNTMLLSANSGGLLGLNGFESLITTNSITMRMKNNNSEDNIGPCSIGISHIPEGEWYHVCFSLTTVQGGANTIYVNGVEGNSGILSTNVTIGDYFPIVGGGYITSYYSLGSSVDQCRVFDRQLTQEEVSVLASEFTGGGFVGTKWAGSQGTFIPAVVTPPVVIDPIPQDFIAHWSGTISGSVLVDETGDYPATISGSVTRAIGRVGEAASFDGVTGIATSPALDLTSGIFSFSSLINTTGSGIDIIFESGANTNSTSKGVVIYLDVNNSPAININYGGVILQIVNLSTPIAVNDGKDHHVTWVVDGSDTSTSQVTIYVDGLPHGVTYAIARQAWTGNSAACYIGARLGATAPYQGKLNRTRVYPRALTPEEIKYLALERPTIPTTNLVAAYNFADMAAGVVPDSAPGATGAYDASVVGTVAKTGMRAGIGLTPTATTDYLEGSIDSSFSQGFTVSCYFKTPNASQNAIFYAKRTVGTGDFQFYYSSTGRLYVHRWSGGTVPSVSWTPVAGVEYHLAAVANNSTVSFYVDGVLIGSVAAAAFSNVSSTYRIFHDFNSTYSLCSISAMRVYDSALTPTEIALLATERQATPTLGLVSHWTMDDVQGTTLIDEMGANDGTITGATQIGGQVGQALSFDGVNDYVALPAAIGDIDSGYISAYVNTNTNCWLLTKTQTTSSTYVFYISFDVSTGKLAVRVKGSTNVTFNTPAASVTAGQHHVVVGNAEGVYFVYIDGVAQALTFTLGSQGAGWLNSIAVPSNELISISRLKFIDLDSYSAADTDAYRMFSTNTLPSPLDILALANET